MQGDGGGARAAQVECTPKKLRGPPKREFKEGERVALSLRMTPALKRRLDAAAERGGRSQSQEAEFRLERSFDRQGLLEEVLVSRLRTTLGGNSDPAGPHNVAMRRRKRDPETPSTCQRLDCRPKRILICRSAGGSGCADQHAVHAVRARKGAESEFGERCR